MTDFTDLPDLASGRFGAAVTAANDAPDGAMRRRRLGHAARP